MTNNYPGCDAINPQLARLRGRQLTPIDPNPSNNAREIFDQLLRAVRRESERQPEACDADD